MSVFRNVGFVSGAITAVLLILTVYDEDVITVEHLLTVITVLGGILAASKLVFLPTFTCSVFFIFSFPFYIFKFS